MEKRKPCLSHKIVKIQPSEKSAQKKCFIKNTEDLVKIEEAIGKGNPNWFVNKSLELKNVPSTTSASKIKRSKALSPIGTLPSLLDSQFTECSPVTGWMAPTLGGSPLAETASQCPETQMVKSLGVNDSTLSWTSSLATPMSAVPWKEEESPEPAKKKGLPRMLFSPGMAGNVGSEMKELSQINDSPWKRAEDCNTDPTVQIKHESCNVENSECRSSNNNVNGKVDNLAHTEKVETLADALSDFFDPPSKAAGRRRSAPTFRTTIPEACRRKRSKSSSQGPQKQEVGKCELLEKDSSQDNQLLGEDVKTEDNKVEDCTMKDNQHTDLPIDRLNNTPIRSDCLKEPKAETLPIITDENFKAKCDYFSQVDLFCSTPIDAKRMVQKSILSTTKKKTPASKKRVRFNEDDLKGDFRHSEEIDSCKKSSEQTLSEDKEKTYNNSETHGNLIKNVEVGEDLFSQVSSSALQEMCSISSEKMDISTATIPVKGEESADNKLCHNDFNENTNLDSSSLSTTVSKSSDKDSAIKREPTELQQTKKPLKRKMFLYPTNSQINTSCPKTVFGFKEETERKEVGQIKTPGGGNIEPVNTSFDVSTTPEFRNTPNVSRTTELEKTTPEVTSIPGLKNITPQVTPTSGSSYTGNKSSSTGFKRYSDLAKNVMVSSKGNNFLPDYKTDTLHKTKEANLCNTPKSTNRDSREIKRRRLLGPAKSPVRPDPIPSNGADQDHLEQIMDIDMFDEELPDDSFSREISLNTTLDKLSGSSGITSGNTSYSSSELSGKLKSCSYSSSGFSSKSSGYDSCKSFELSTSKHNMEKQITPSVYETKIKSHYPMENSIPRRVLVENFERQYIQTCDNKKDIMNFDKRNENDTIQCLDVNRESINKKKNLVVDETKLLKAETVIKSPEVNKSLNFSDDIVVSQENEEDYCDIQDQVNTNASKLETQILDVEIRTMNSFDKEDKAAHEPNHHKVIIETSVRRSEISTGFTSASGKKSYLSEDKLSKAKSMMDEAASVDIKIEHNKSSNFGTYNQTSDIANSDGKTVVSSLQNIPGFSSASGKTMNLSESGILKAKSMMESIDIETNYLKMPGFSSDSGKACKLSDSSLSKARALMLGEESSDQEMMTGQKDKPDFSKSSTTSKDHLKIIDENEKKITTYQGFSTASGKTLKVPESSLTKAKSMMKDVENGESVLKTISAGEDNLMCFSTASGKSLKLSTESLLKAKTLMQEAESTDEGGNDTTIVKKCPESIIFKTSANASNALCSEMKGNGFSTASGKSMKLSTDSLSKAKSLMMKKDNTNDFSGILNDEKRSDVVPQNEILFQGFSTAGGRGLKLSASSLSKAHSLMKDIDKSESTSIENSSLNSHTSVWNNQVEQSKELKQDQGFSTAAGKSLNISESSLCKAQSLMEKIESPGMSIELEVKACEFSTASGKGLQMSGHCINKASRMMKNIDSEPQPSTSGLQKSKKDLFEDMFNSLLKGENEESIDQVEKNNITENTEDELETLLSKGKLTGKGKGPLKPVKSSRFPPGAVVPKGFRPFKPPKLIAKPEVKETVKVEIEIKDNKTLNTAEGCKMENFDHMVEKCEKGPTIETTPAEDMESSYLEEVFSDEMLPSQKFSPESGRPLRKYSDDNKNIVKSIKTDTVMKANEHVGSTMISGTGDKKGGEYFDIDTKVDFKGDNSNLTIEQLMDPENDFSQTQDSHENSNTSSFGSKARENLGEKLCVTDMFQSASGKCISVSLEALQHAHKSLNEEESNSSFPKSDIQADSIDKKTMLNPFQSASGKTISVSEKALQHARSTLYDEELHSVQEEIRSNPFLSAAGRSISVSNKTLLHARKTLEECNDQSTGCIVSTKDDSSTKANPFQSASGKAVMISEKALMHARQTLSDDKFENSSETNNLQMEKKGNNTNDNLSDLNSLQVVPDLTSKQAEETHCTDNSWGKANPFQSASGKPISVSEKSLKHARQTLHENDSDALSNEVLNEFETNNNMDAEKDMFQNFVEDKATLNTNPFQSASGKSISVSEKALEQVRKTLNEDNSSNVMFQSASGKTVQVSDSAIEHARTTLNEESTSGPLCKNENTKSQQNFESLFQSASGKDVNISDKALQHVRSTFKDEMPPLHEQILSASTQRTEFSPFQSASGKNVKVSDQALQHARSALAENTTVELERTTHTEHTTPNPFQSASGKTVQVSSKALQQIKQKQQEEALETSAARKSLSFSEGANNKPDQSHIDVSSKQKMEVTPTSKRKRSDFEDDFDVPAEILDQMEMYGKRPKVEETSKKKPLSAVPEDYSKDRQVPGFSPKPLKSMSMHSTPRSRLEELLPGNPSAVTPKSTFKAPYKATPASEPVSVSSNKVKVVAPVFVPKSSNPSTGSGSKVMSQQKEAMKPGEVQQPTHMKSMNRNVKPYISTKDTAIPQLGIGQKHEISVIKPNCSAKETPIHQNAKSQNNQRSVIKTGITDEMVQLIGNARQQQEAKIKEKSKMRAQPVEGRLYQMKQTQGRLKLRDVIDVRNKAQIGMVHVNQSTRQVRCSNAGLHKFYLPDFYGKNIHTLIVGDGARLVPDDKGYAGRQEFYDAFLAMDGVDSKLISDKWFFNHYRWVVWKLASYEVNSPRNFGGRSLTPEVVMLQMKYRYDREIDRCQRSAIMKICERDDTACKRMVLCVADIVQDYANKETKVTLTDGWYSINGKVDSPLAALIKKGSIQVGHKLCMSGAELVGSQNACPPLETPESLMLKMSSNSTRPVAWDCRQGYQTDISPLCIPLSSVHGDGGLIGCLDAVVVRKYPTMYMEKLPAGGCVFRSYAAEEKYKQTFQNLQQEKMEKLYQQIERECEKGTKEEKCTKKKNWTSKEIENLGSGEEIYEAINSSKHPDDVQMNLSSHQLELLLEYQRSLQEDKRQQLNSRFQKAWNDDEQTVKDRVVVPLMKIRVVGCCRRDCDSQTSSLLTIWRPSSAHSDLDEGKRYKIYSLTSSSPRPGSTGIPLTATKQTQFKPLPIDDNILDMIYEQREVSTKQDMIRKRPPYREVDLVGIVISLVNSTFESSGKQQDIVYIQDINEDFIGIKFWGGLKHVGLSETLKEGVVCCCSNLCDRSNYMSTFLPIVEYSAELSVISPSPQYSNQRKHVEKLKPKIKDKEYLLMTKEMLGDKLNRKSGPGQIKSPENVNNNITESILDSGKTPNSKVAPKMAALMAYSSPSPLSPVVLASTKSIHKAFKSPMIAKK